MPRRAFVADFQRAQQDVLPSGISNLQQGDDDGQFQFHFTVPGLQEATVPSQITALIPELSDYPSSHEYMIFGEADTAPAIVQALHNLRRTNGKTVFELLDIVSTTLTALSPDKDGDTQMQDSQFDDDQQDEEDEDDENVYDSDDEAFEFSGAGPTTTSYSTVNQNMNLPKVDKASRDRVRNDLQAAKVDFKVGVLGDIFRDPNAFVTVSIRMSKLGISQEAMQAWQVVPSDYLILILQYPNGYKRNEDLLGFDSARLESNLGMRVCAGKSYKPTLQEAINAFTITKKSRNDISSRQSISEAKGDAEESSIKDVFISKPLNSLLKERLIPVLRLRGLGLDWNGAERAYISRVNAGSAKDDAIPDHFFVPEPVNGALPAMVNRDHLADGSASPRSFPLIAMQFLLRHFVRCTEFCLVCHQKLNTDLEAIKPYVCDSELCLYQYMALGFGPSIEWELKANPYVVDLLVSFCYNSAAMKKLKEFPDGLSLVVPPVSALAADENEPYRHSRDRNHQKNSQKAAPSITDSAPTFDIGFDYDLQQFIFPKAPEVCPVRSGDWIVISTTGTLEGSEIHCRVEDASLFPTISISKPIVLAKAPKTGSAVAGTGDKGSEALLVPKPATPSATPKWITATFQRYGEDFKALTSDEKCWAICKLLSTLPNVKILQEYVSTRSSADLRNWTDRISPAALSLLRWIIASNRACIMQVDGDEDSTSKRKEERLWGMKDYMQFRFAMGAPDKEQRFITEVRKTAERLNLQYPTLFAWHGSPLYNWHAIIREGLHYKNIDHGRAYGDGVYHALDAHTSGGYSSRAYVGSRGSTTDIGTWPSSLLMISSALALNEIVNAPEEFTSQTPYYVIKQLEWIQTRYLFVQCTPAIDSIKVGAETKPTKVFAQDPKRVPRGVSDSVIIPASAIKRSKKNATLVTRDSFGQSPLKKLKTDHQFGGLTELAQAQFERDEDDTASISTTTSDYELLFDDDIEPDDMPVLQGSFNTVLSKPKGPMTDFIAGSLDFNKLPLMPMPTYATSSTTTRLMKELQNMAKAQNVSNLCELGWYCDVEKIENVYQWIVELHSFHTFEIKGQKLPLVDDMKKRNIKSIVLEIRYNKDFPFTPPYVRVIRPRFLSLMQGGGGHIVLGGAMCMELLTNTGWSSVSSMESVLMQIRLAIASEPFARLDVHNNRDYGVHEAAEGYIRTCERHGWQIPPGFKEMAFASGSSGAEQDGVRYG